MIDLHEGEKVIYEVRKHWIILVSQILFLISLKILPIFILALIPFLPINFSIQGSSPIFIVFVYFCWLNIIWILIFYIWTNYKLTLWVITDKRIIMMHQNGFFNREKKEIQFEKVQDITVEQEGLMAHIFKFGNLHITSASETGGFLMDSIGHPEVARSAISARVHKQEAPEPSPVQPRETSPETPQI